MWRWAHSFQSKMWTSVPQIEEAATSINTSLPFGSGTATWSISAPGPAAAFTTAVMDVMLTILTAPKPVFRRSKSVQEGAMRAYVLINASAGKAIEVARSRQGVKGIELADAITGEYDVIAAVEAPDVAGIGSIIVEKIQKIDGVFKTVTCLAVR